jgi:hypothetical protein
MRSTSFASVLTLVALAVAARGDEVVTKSGTIYAGRVLAEDETSVTVDTAALGPVKLARADVTKVSRDAAAPTAATPSTAPAEAASAPAAPNVAKPKPAPLVEDVATLSAEEREARRQASKIVRRTAPTASKRPDASTSGAATAVEERPTLGGTQLARTPPGSWVVVFEPPRQFEAAPSGVQIGRRVYARLESTGVASAWLASPYADGERRSAVRLADVQRHCVLPPDGSRLRMIEGVEKGAWLRVRLEDDTTAEGSLTEAHAGVVVLSKCLPDGAPQRVEVPDAKIVEVDGLLRSTSTRLAINDLAVGEAVGMTLWPDGREIVGTLQDRTERVATIVDVDGDVVRVPVDGPIADVRRVPARLRSAVADLQRTGFARVRSSEEFADARVDRDVVGAVVALTAYALSLDTGEGVVVTPFDAMTALTAADADMARVRRKKSTRACDLHVLPGDGVEKLKTLEPLDGVAVVADGRAVRAVVVTAPFEGPVFGIRLGDRATTAQERTDLRFDTTVVPRPHADGRAPPTEMTSHTLAGLRVTMLVDAGGVVSTIELASR